MIMSSPKEYYESDFRGLLPGETEGSPPGEYLGEDIGSCLFCGDGFEDGKPFILWRVASPNDIVIHGDCARQLGIELIIDAGKFDALTTEGGRRVLLRLLADIQAIPFVRPPNENPLSP